MIVKNLMENKVEEIAKNFLKEKHLLTNTRLFSDIVAYTLNRIPPQYVSSARGILHKYADNEKIQISADIYSIIGEAFTVVQRRDSENFNEPIPTIAEDGFYIVYPVLTGNIFYANNFSRVMTGNIAAYSNDAIIPNYGSNFMNPFIINQYTPGRYIFSFLPKKVKDDSLQTVQITLKTNIDGMEEHLKNISIDVRGVFYVKNSLPVFRNEDVENIYIIKQEE